MSLMVSVDVRQHWTMLRHWSQFVPNMSTDIRGHEALHHHHQTKGSELRSCVKVEVVVLGSPSLIICTVSVDVKQHWTKPFQVEVKQHWTTRVQAQELCERQGCRPGLPSRLYCLCADVKHWRKSNSKRQSSRAVWKSRWPSLAPRP